MFALLVLPAAYAGDEDWAEYFPKFQAAVAARDAEGVADLTAFPFGSWDLAGRLPRRLRTKGENFLELDRDEFLAAWPYLFDRRARGRVAAGNAVEVLDGMGVGIWSGKGWTVWLQFNPDDAGQWRLNSTQNVSGGD
jgi:hypothetical protein